MSQGKELINALKSQLKAHSKTYLDVAEHLNLSHASVKRLFSDETISLNRLEAICDMIGITLAELVLSMSIKSNKIDKLTLTQEQEIADDVLLLLVTVCVINGFTYQNLLDKYIITEHQLIQKLAKLDKLKIIDLLPSNRFKLLITKNFGWLPDGPIQRFFLQRVQEEFFSSRFNQSTEKLMVVNGLLSLGANAELQKKMQRLINEFTEHKDQDTCLSMEERAGTTMVLALRQWNSSLFKDIERDSDKK